MCLTSIVFRSATIGINICAAVIILLPSIPPTMRQLMFYFNAVIINIMACRAFRQLRFEMMQDCVPSFSVNLSGIQWNGGVSRAKDLEWVNTSDVRGNSTGDNSSIEANEVTATAKGDLEKGTDSAELTHQRRRPTANLDNVCRCIT